MTPMSTMNPARSIDRQCSSIPGTSPRSEPHPLRWRSGPNEEPTRFARYKSRAGVLAITAIAVLACAPIASAKPSHPTTAKSIPLTTIQGYASTLAGQPIVISCDSDVSLGADAGYVILGQTGTQTIHIAKSACAAVENIEAPGSQMRNTSAFFTFGGKRADTDGGTGLIVIEHEVMHAVLQSADEGLVECTAFQNRWAFVRLFHFPAWIANEEMAGMAWNHSQMPAAYRTDC